MGVGYVHVVGIEPSYFREYIRCDSEHAHWDTSTGRRMRRSFGPSFAWSHGSLNGSRPPSTYFELGGLTPHNLRYAGAT